MDYFTKWADAIPLRDQKATTITDAVVKICSNFGMPKILHSDQGRNFESTLFNQVLKAFGIKKCRATAYHPQGDGMVERFNRSLLQLLRCYVDSEDDWERYLPLVFYAYRTAQHSLTGVSPFQLMFGRPPQSASFQQPIAFDPATYSSHLQAKLASLQDLVHTNLTANAYQQKMYYDKHTHTLSFSPGDLVWLSVPTQRKWEVIELKNPVNVTITDGQNTKVVHINRLQHHKQPEQDVVPSSNTCTYTSWAPPQIDHYILSESPSEQRYPQRSRRPPDRLCL